MVEDLVDDQELRSADLERMRDAFNQRSDMSRLIDLNGWNSRRLDERHERLGEGGHFTAWRLREPVEQQQTRHGPMALVYKRAHSGFGASGGPKQRDWLKALQLIKKPLELVPPILTGPLTDGGVSLLMPFGDAPLAAAAAHWRPIEPRVAALRAALAALSLEWPDVVQARCWEGIPFVFDWSELRLR